jgi:hypothetical protein
MSVCVVLYEGWVLGAGSIGYIFLVAEGLQGFTVREHMVHSIVTPAFRRRLRPSAGENVGSREVDVL